MGHEFVDLFTTEVRLLTDNYAVSDCLMTYCPVTLHRNYMVRVVLMCVDFSRDVWRCGSQTILKLYFVRLNTVLLSGATGSQVE